jgi:hypothetical protein
MAQQRHLAWPTYLVAFALSAIPPFDALMQLLPMRLHDPRWRFGFFGLMSNAMMIPLVGVLIAFVAASIFEHRRFQRVLGGLATVVVVCALVMLALFALDALQVRPQVKPAAALAFNVATVTAIIKSLLGVATLSAFAVAAFRGPRLRRSSTASAANTIVVGGGIGAPKAMRVSPAPQPVVSTIAES